MKRTLTVIGLAIIVVVGGVAASQAQGRQGPPGAIGPHNGRPGIMQGMGPGMSGRGPQGAMRGGGPGGPGRMGGRGVGLRGLDLTEAQKTQIQALRQQHQRELEAVLTPEQVAKLRARRRE